jgi:hypothetical protein
MTLTVKLACVPRIRAYHQIHDMAGAVQLGYLCH